MTASLAAVFAAVVLPLTRTVAAPKSIPLHIPTQTGALLLLALSTEHRLARLATKAFTLLLDAARRTGSCMTG